MPPTLAAPRPGSPAEHKQAPVADARRWRVPGLVAPGGEQGEASGVLGTGRIVGQSLSVAIAGAVFFATLSQVSVNPAYCPAATSSHFWR
jgi:hypothetical protein